MERPIDASDGAAKVVEDCTKKRDGHVTLRSRIDRERIERNSFREKHGLKEKQHRIFEAEFDTTGVYFYQAFKRSIAEYALKHQRFGGPEFKPVRMTWIKPSFAWVCYRAGYGTKKNQERVLKIKLLHKDVTRLLSQCSCGHGGGGTDGRVQWDPKRDMYRRQKVTKDWGVEPRKCECLRAIQIGLKGPLSRLYVESALKIEDVTNLARQMGEAHAIDDKEKRMSAIEDLLPSLPKERPYMPRGCSEDVLKRLCLKH